MFMLRRWALARNCGSFAMSARADSHFFVIASGVAAGNATAAHHCTRTPLITPSSSAVGTSGNALRRDGESTASTLILRASRMAWASATEWMASTTWPPASLVMESAAPGVMTILVLVGSTPICVIQSNAAYREGPDGPTDDHTSSPGCAFTHAENSLNVFQGASALTAKTMGSRTIRAAYLRSASVSGGLFWAPISIDEIVWMSMSSV